MVGQAHRLSYPPFLSSRSHPSLNQLRHDRLRMSIRLRLTLWYTLVLIVLLAVLGAGIYTTLSNNLRLNIDTQLTDTADRILSASRVRQFSNILQVDVPEELDIFRAPGVAVVVIDNDHIQAIRHLVPPPTMSID